MAGAQYGLGEAAQRWHLHLHLHLLLFLFLLPFTA